MLTKPRVLTLRLKGAEDGTLLLVECGNVELERKINEGYGLVRLNAIFDASGKLLDVEVITDKLE